MYNAPDTDVTVTILWNLFNEILEIVMIAQREHVTVTATHPATPRPAFDFSRYRFNLETLKQTYKATYSTRWRELGKWIFSIATFGLGGLYLWATTLIVKEGEIAMRRNARGEMILLPPGRHSNFPWESYVRAKPAPRPSPAPQGVVTSDRPGEETDFWGRWTVPISENFIQFGPKTIFTVKTGQVAKTYLHGELAVFPEGQYCLEDSAHVVNKHDAFISVQEETKVLPEVTALTKNNVTLKIQADVRYKIVDPVLAITTVDDIEKTISELAKVNIARVVNHHDLSEFTPVTADPSNTSNVDREDASEDDNTGLSRILNELTRQLTAQFRSRGIELISISTTSWCIDDAALAHELGQVAAIQARARSSLLSAQQEKQIQETKAIADANATRTRAEGQADAVKKLGASFLEVAQSMNGDPMAAQLFQMELQKAWFANNPHVFFNIGGGNQPTMPLILAGGQTPAMSMNRSTDGGNV